MVVASKRRCNQMRDKIIIIFLVIIILIISIIVGTFIFSFVPEWLLLIGLVLLFIRDEYKRKKRENEKK